MGNMLVALGRRAAFVERAPITIVHYRICGNFQEVN